MSKNDLFKVRRVEVTWTSNKKYEILRGRKVVLQLGDRDEANKVCEYLNTLPIGSSNKKSSKKKTSKVAKQDKLEGEASE